MNNRRQEDPHLEILQTIKVDMDLVKEGLHAHLNSPAHQYIDALMAREAKRQKLWDAIIEKTLAGLVYSMLIVVLSNMWIYIRDHWKW